MQVINKKIIVIFICLSIFIFGVFKLFNKEKVVLDNVILDMNNSKDRLAIYIEEYDEEGNASYVESKDSTFPLDNNYVYNKELSGCLDSNSNEVEDALNYNFVNKELNLRVNKPVTCYVYYDYKGNGTEKVPYKIRSIEDLLDLSKKVNDGETYIGKYFELTRDLDFNDTNSYNDSERTDYGNLNGITDDNNTLKNEMTTGTGWVSIGKNSTISFQGIFDGNNKIIKNIYIDNNIAEIGVGLFGNTNYSNLKNLTLDGNIKTTKIANMGSFIGNANDTTLDNCVSKVNVTSTAGSWSSGGLVGATYNTVTIKNSHNEGNVTGGAWIGGLVGGFDDGTLTIEDSYNTGTISKVDDVEINGIGGLVGAAVWSNSSWNINITNSYNTGEISDTPQTERITYLGGLIGRSVVELSISGSYNEGNINLDGSQSEGKIGGLVGEIDAKLVINDSHNSGNISNEIIKYDTIKYLVFGGLIGDINIINSEINIIENSYNDGNITGGYQIGGIIGKDGGNNTLIVNKSFNKGTISSDLDFSNASGYSNIYLGGLIGAGDTAPSIYVLNSYNNGEPKAENAQATEVIVTGIMTKNGKNVILNSYNNAPITSVKMAIGLILQMNGSLQTNNVFTVGNLSNSSIYGFGRFDNSVTKNLTNTYYQNKYFEYPMEGLTGLNDNQFMNKEQINNQYLVDILNSKVDELNSAGLSSIDPILKDYTLSKWQKDANGYPMLIND